MILIFLKFLCLFWFLYFPFFLVLFLVSIILNFSSYKYFRICFYFLQILKILFLFLQIFSESSFNPYKYNHLTLNLNSRNQKPNNRKIKRGTKIKIKILEGPKLKILIFIETKNIFKPIWFSFWHTHTCITSQLT